MTEGPPREIRPQLARLGGELRRVRVLAGLSGRQIADAVGISQPTVSRIERGASVPSLRELIAWADATEVSEDRRALLLGLGEAAVNEVTPLRDRTSGGLAAVQEDVRELEATARTLRNFQPGIVPGLLQTAAYAQSILALAALFMTCNIWRQAGENGAESLSKGTRVIVTGRLRQRLYETKEHEKRTVYEIEVDEVGVSLRNAARPVGEHAERPGLHGIHDQAPGQRFRAERRISRVPRPPSCHRR